MFKPAEHFRFLAETFLEPFIPAEVGQHDFNSGDLLIPKIFRSVYGCHPTLADDLQNAIVT
jgi:hypothetical protein